MLPEPNNIQLILQEWGELAVNSQEVANKLSLRRKRQTSCYFEESINQPPMIIYATSLFLKKIQSSLNILILLLLPSFTFEMLVEYSRETDWPFLQIENQLASFFELTANLPLSPNLQPNPIFLPMYSYVSNILDSVRHSCINLSPSKFYKSQEICWRSNKRQERRERMVIFNFTRRKKAL